MLAKLLPQPAEAGEIHQNAERRLPKLTIEPATVLCVSLMLSGLSSWWISLRSVDLAAMTDLGLVSVLTPGFFVAFALIAAAFCVALRRPSIHTSLVVFCVLATIVVLYGTTSVVEPFPRFAVTWRHVGITELISRTGGVRPELDAYFNWPGFFILAALIVQATGLHSALDFVTWFPVFINVLYMGPLLMIMRSATKDRRVAWLAIYLFYLCNWIGQDYFSPQGLNLFLYLVVFAVLLTWFKSSPGTAPTPAGWSPSAILRSHMEPPNQVASGGVRAALMGVVLLVCVFSVTSHQLTPFAIAMTLGALAIFKRVMPRGLVVLVGLLIFSWLLFVAMPYLDGHVNDVAGSVGNVAGNLSANLGQRVQGSPEHLVVLRVRLIMTVAIWLLAGVGLTGRVWRRQFDVTMALMAGAPFFLLGLQAYGGEMILRAYLFSLAPMAYFAASAFFVRPVLRVRWHRLLAIYLVSVTLFAGFLFARFGNERVDYFTSGEVTGLEALYKLAPQGSHLIAASTLPWRFRDYEKYTYSGIGDHPEIEEPGIMRSADAASVLTFMREQTRNGLRNVYLVTTRSEESNIDLFSGMAPGALTRLNNALEATGQVRVVFRNSDTLILTLSDPPKGATN